jgi:hypothetical protein
LVLTIATRRHIPEDKIIVTAVKISQMTAIFNPTYTECEMSGGWRVLHNDCDYNEQIEDDKMEGHGALMGTKELRIGH